MRDGTPGLEERVAELEKGGCKVRQFGSMGAALKTYRRMLGDYYAGKCNIHIKSDRGIIIKGNSIGAGEPSDEGEETEDDETEDDDCFEEEKEGEESSDGDDESSDSDMSQPGATSVGRKKKITKAAKTAANLKLYDQIIESSNKHNLAGRIIVSGKLQRLAKTVLADTMRAHGLNADGRPLVD